MGIGNSITLIGCLAGMVVALPALLIFLSMVFYRGTERGARRLQRGGIVPFFMGAVPLAIAGGFGSILLSIGSVFQFFGTIVWLLILMWGFTGMAAVARMIGWRLNALLNRSENPLMDVLLGSVVLTFAISFPLIGWFVIWPLSIFIGTGAYNMAVFGNLWDRLFSREVVIREPQKNPANYEASEATL